MELFDLGYEFLDFTVADCAGLIVHQCVPLPPRPLELQSESPLFGREEALQFPKGPDMVGMRADADLLKAEKNGGKLEGRVVGEGETSVGIEASDISLN